MLPAACTAPPAIIGVGTLVVVADRRCAWGREDEEDEIKMLRRPLAR